MSDYINYPEERFSWSKLSSLEEDKRSEYINKYCVFDFHSSCYILRTDVNTLVRYNSRQFGEILNKINIKGLKKYIQPATRKDDWKRPRQWIYIEEGDRYYNMFMGLREDVINGETSPVIEKMFEEFVNSFADGSDLIPLKRVIGSLAMNAGRHLPVMVCIASDTGFGKDVLFNILKSWYDPSEVANSSIERLVGNFNIDAGKCLVCLNECHDRSISTVNKIKDIVTADEVTINNKYGNIVTKENHMTLFCFSNSPQGIPVDFETADRRAIFYNLIGKKDRSIAKKFMTLYANSSYLASSCWKKACEWFDPDYDFYRNIVTTSKNIMQENNMPDLVSLIYENKLYGQKIKTNDLRNEIYNTLGKCLTPQQLRKIMVSNFGEGIYLKSNGNVYYDLRMVKEYIEKKWNLQSEEVVEEKLANS